MPPKKYATQDQLKDVENKVDNCNAIIFDIKDNHLKSMTNMIHTMKGRQDIILIMLSALLGSGVVGGLVALILRFTG